jgi:formate dehydrogenase iron-sulfur subunit
MSILGTAPSAAGRTVPGSSSPLVTLVSILLNDQRDLTAVERFAQRHEDATEPLNGRFYSALLPGRPPGPREQYAFEVELDRCSGCKACVAACHSLNGLDDGESWREVGLIIGGGPDLPVLQHVTSSCHHCIDPACLTACPVDAYEKDPRTGIVKHLDDQCFGCQYCILACPYDAPKFHPEKGIVRKCDMCADRLSGGEAPACVQACPHEAIRIRVVDRDEVVALAETGGFLPTAPDPSYTLPTTRYITRRPRQGTLRAADHHRSKPEPAHLPLAVMLVLTQAATGGFLIEAAARGAGVAVSPALPLASLILGLAGIGASVLHLGRPMYAYRAVIGVRHSWLSREVVAFALFASLASAHMFAVIWRPNLSALGSAAAAAAGLIAVLCSVMVYHVVRRPFWSASTSVPKFGGTVVVAGLSAGFVAASGSPPCGLALAAAMIIRLTWDCAVMTHERDPRLTPLRRSAELLRGPLLRLGARRLVLGGIGGIALPLLTVAAGESSPALLKVVLSGVAFLVVIAGELSERLLFFQAVARPKMPGGITS